MRGKSFVQDVLVLDPVDEVKVEGGQDTGKSECVSVVETLGQGKGEDLLEL